MPRVLRGEAFAFEDVAEVTFAVGADDLDAAAVGIGVLVNSSGNFIIEARPSATRFEFISGLIEWLVALAADVGSGEFVVFVLAGAGAFGAFVEEDALFFGGERIVSHCRIDVLRKLNNDGDKKDHASNT